MESRIIGDDLVLTIPSKYLKNTAECGLTTGVFGEVSDVKGMLRHYKKQLSDIKDDCHFNRCLDIIAADALEDGEPWISIAEEE